MEAYIRKPIHESIKIYSSKTLDILRKIRDNNEFSKKILKKLKKEENNIDISNVISMFIKQKKKDINSLISIVESLVYLQRMNELLINSKKITQKSNWKMIDNDTRLLINQNILPKLENTDIVNDIQSIEEKLLEFSILDFNS